jgi:hypothetical protein
MEVASRSESKKYYHSIVQGKSSDKTGVPSIGDRNKPILMKNKKQSLDEKYIGLKRTASGIREAQQVLANDYGIFNTEYQK